MSFFIKERNGKEKNYAAGGARKEQIILSGRAGQDPSRVTATFSQCPALYTGNWPEEARNPEK